MKLPISFNEVMYGQVVKKTIKDGDKVKCLRCGKTIKLTPATVKGIHSYDAYVICPNKIGHDEEKDKDIICGYRCDAYYYARKEKND